MLGKCRTEAAGSSWRAVMRVMVMVKVMVMVMVMVMAMAMVMVVAITMDAGKREATT